MAKVKGTYDDTFDFMFEQVATAKETPKADGI